MHAPHTYAGVYNWQYKDITVSLGKTTRICALNLGIKFIFVHMVANFFTQFKCCTIIVCVCIHTNNITIVNQLQISNVVFERRSIMSIGNKFKLTTFPRLYHFPMLIPLLNHDPLSMDIGVDIGVDMSDWGPVDE
jgi:hypothetical protein